jgi:hypothetical protein
MRVLGVAFNLDYPSIHFMDEDSTTTMTEKTPSSQNLRFSRHDVSFHFRFERFTITSKASAFVRHFILAFEMPQSGNRQFRY